MDMSMGQLLWYRKCKVCILHIYYIICFSWNNLLDVWDNEDPKMFTWQSVTESLLT